MTTYFVTRHQGAIEWAKQQSIVVDKQMEHLDLALITSNDIVIGSLPVNLAAEICSKNSRYIHLSLDVPLDMRGKELTVEDMNICKARLEEFKITKEVNNV